MMITNICIGLDIFCHDFIDGNIMGDKFSFQNELLKARVNKNGNLWSVK